MVVLQPREMDKLAHLWDFHRFECHHNGDMKIEHRPGGGIGTKTVAICGCGREMDVTDYESW
jgi:hypothetical protein